MGKERRRTLTERNGNRECFLSVFHPIHSEKKESFLKFFLLFTLTFPPFSCRGKRPEDNGKKKVLVNDVLGFYIPLLRGMFQTVTSFFTQKILTFL